MQKLYVRHGRCGWWLSCLFKVPSADTTVATVVMANAQRVGGLINTFFFPQYNDLFGYHVNAGSTEKYARCSQPRRHLRNGKLIGQNSRLQESYTVLDYFLNFTFAQRFPVEPYHH